MWQHADEMDQGMCRDSVKQDGSNVQHKRRSEGTVVLGLWCGQKLYRRVLACCCPNGEPRLWNDRRFPSTVLTFERTTVKVSLNKRPPLRSAMLLEIPQPLRGSLGLWVPRAQHTLLCGQRGREQGHGRRCLALEAECSGEYVGYSEA